MSWEIAVTFGIVAIAFTLIYLGLHLKQDHAIIKFFFIMIGLFMLIMQLALNEQLIRANELNIGNSTISANLITQSNSIYQGGLYVGILTITYFFLYFMINLITSIKGGGRGRSL